MNSYLAKHVEVWNSPYGGCTFKTAPNTSECPGAFIKGPLDNSCRDDGTIWRKGVGHCKPET